MPSNKKSFPLRLDPDLYRAIEQWAGDEFRSVNAHIEFLLREALRKAGRLPAPERRRTAGNPAGLSDREPDRRHGVNTDDSGHSGK
jgi:hypothetical protein